MLGDQALPDPPGSMTLLARRVLIRDEPSVNHAGPLVNCWTGPGWIQLAWRRDRIGKGLAHRPAMCAMSLRQLTDREILETAVSSDFFEQFHA